jgi:ABC-type lipoprotein release transport system permease subunit
VRRFVFSQFRFRRSRTVALAAAILVASVSFVVLTSTAQTSSIRVQGTLKSSFRPAYDILVRPNNSQTQLERADRLVRPNFLAGVFGGISFKQWHDIQRIRGVEVAAPIANVGWMMPFENFVFPITHLVDDSPFQLYRIKPTWIANGGLERYPGADMYVYYTPRNRFSLLGNFWMETGPRLQYPVPSCMGFTFPGQPQSPFPPLNRSSYLACFPSERSSRGYTVNGFDLPSRGFVGAIKDFYFPVFISAIDPVQEARLIHLKRTVVSGRYFKPNEGLSRIELRGGFGGPSFHNLVPVLASVRTYVDERLDLTIERLRIPRGTNVPRAMATGACLSATESCTVARLPPPRGATYRDAREFVAGLPGRVIERRTIPIAAAYRQLVAGRAGTGWPVGTFGYHSYWTSTPARYRSLGPDRLEPIPVHNPKSIWQSQFSNYYTPPRINLDPQFRRLHQRLTTNIFDVHNVARFATLHVVGSFDPEKLPSFSPLSKVPMETYFPPELLPADSAARKALRGRSYLPNQNLGGYVQQPPLLLTTMRGLRTFLDPEVWLPSTVIQHLALTGEVPTAIPKAQRRAPISAIRIKVAGVTGPDPLSLERIRVVARKIYDQTGLTVDITAGSSPHPVNVLLPKGRFGQPPLWLQEGWSQKGATVSFLRALDRKDLGLFALVLVITAVFLGNGVLAAVRARRVEVGTLLTFGWSRAAIFAAVLAEVLVVGVVAGAVGTGVAALLAVALSLDLPLLKTLLVWPLAVVLALASGLVPAWLAARGEPLDALRPVVIARSRTRPVRRLLSLALVNLRRLPARTLIGVAGLFVGVAALAVLLGIERAFQGTLVGTVLGNALSVQVRGADFAAVGLTIGLAALSVADVLYLNLRERAAEIVTLRTLGWSERQLRQLVLLEALGLGLLGAGAGALVGFAVGAGILGVPAGPLALACLVAAVGGIAAALLASLLPLSQLNRLAVPAVLAAE